MDRETRRAAGWTALILLLAAIATALNLGPRLAALGPERAFGLPQPTDLDALLMHYSLLPRLAAGALCGAALALAGTLFQQVLRNPVASPSTIGVEAGAGLALAMATLYAPTLLGWGRDLSVLLGAFLAMGIVFGMAARFRFSPLVVILGGLVVGFYCGAVTTTLTLMHEHYLAGLLIWGSGSLAQQDWRIVQDLLPRLAAGSLLAGLMVRPLTLLQLDETAASLGLRLSLVRLGALAAGAALTAFCVGAVGVIGFLGLIAPALARAAGARRFATRMVIAPLIGAGLLILTDQLLQVLGSASGIFLPAGAVTAVIGAPAMLLLLRRMPSRMRPPAATSENQGRRATTPVLAVLATVLLGTVIAVTIVGRDVDGGWLANLGAALDPLLAWRLPRTIGALAAGAMLAVTGVILQRMTGNAMASPEVLGVSAGAALGLMAVLFILPAPGYLTQTGAMAAGALAALAGLLWLVRRARLSGNRVLLAGVTLGAFLMALMSLVTATGDPRALLLMTWMTGSTYAVDGTRALIAAIAAIAALICAPAMSRPLELLSLSPVSARTAGVDVRRTQFWALGLCAGLSAVATLVVGPLSFVGLIGPHLARRAGLARCLPQMLGAALTGALLMAMADFLGRTVYFPWQLPAGMISALLGGPALVLLLIWRPKT